MGTPPTRGWGASPPTSAGSERRAADYTPARRLLRRLVELMALPVPPQERLNRIVGLVASDLVAEVCSVYALRAGDVLELFSTQGLEAKAVHLTRIRVGEGLVGQIARSGDVVNLADAKSDPRFAYFPETGEEIYNAFLGVPVIRDGRVVGVVVVQNQAKRSYAEDEIEALQVVATVLGEVLAADPHLRAESAVARSAPARLEGVRLSDGIAIGEAWPHRVRVEVTRLVADDPAAENERLTTAVRSLRASVDAMLDLPEIAEGEQREVLEAYQMFARDAGWLRRMREAVNTGLSAEAAVKRVQEQTRLRMSQIQDAYLRERLIDLDDLADRLLLLLAGRPIGGSDPQPPDKYVLIARSLSPAELLDHDRERLCAVVLEEGSPTAHVTILARALGIPMLGRVEGALDAVARGDLVAVDANHGHVYLRPGEDVEQVIRRSMATREGYRRAYASLRDVPAATRDGVRVRLHLNAAFLFDMEHLKATGADGIGLYRTELGFMVRNTTPSVEHQTRSYARVLDAAEGKPVVFRTLDVGGDKMVPYWRFPKEENPAMGWRAIRMTLDRPAVLRAQLRALIRAADGRPLSVMFPMIAEVAELQAASRLVDMEIERARGLGAPLPESLRLGAMLEVPALLWQLPALLARVDFLSIGSNDLMQFLFACDRGNPELIDRYDRLAPPVLAFIRDLVARCRRAGVELSICGEMASRPLEAMALVGLGVRNLSLMPSDHGQVKAMIRSLSCGRLTAYLDGLYELPDHSLRGRLHNYALDHAVHLEGSGVIAS